MGKIRGDLKSLDKEKIRPDLEIKDNIKRKAAELKQLERTRTVKLRTEVDKASAAKAKTQMRMMADGGQMQGGFDASAKGPRHGPWLPPNWQSKSGGSWRPSGKGAGQGFRGPKTYKIDGEDRSSSRGIHMGAAGLDKGEVRSASRRWQPRNDPGIDRREIGSFSEDYKKSLEKKQKSLKKQRTAQKAGVEGLYEFFDEDTETTKDGVPKGIAEKRKKYGINVDDDDDTFTASSSPLNTRAAYKLRQHTNKASKSVQEMSDGFKSGDTNLGSLKGKTKKFTDNLRKYTPNIMMWWKLVAILLPMMIMLRVHMMGVAAAGYAIAGAGAAMIGGGMLGFGEQLADGMAHAERAMNRLRRDMFQVFRPALQEFAPISDQFLRSLPTKLAPIADSLRGLTAFEGPMNRVFDHLVSMVPGFINTIVGYADDFEQIVVSFANTLEPRIHRFFDWLVGSTLENEEMMGELMDVFRDILFTVYNLLHTASQFMALLQPVIEMGAKFGDIITHDWIAPIVTFLAKLYVVAAALNTVRGMFTLIAAQVALLSKVSFLGLIGGVAALAAHLWSAATAMSILTLGKAAVVGIGAMGVASAWTHSRFGISGGSGGSGSNTQSGDNSGSGGNTYNYNVTVEGDTNKHSLRTLESSFDGFAEERETQENKTSYSGSPGV